MLAVCVQTQEALHSCMSLALNATDSVLYHRDYFYISPKVIRPVRDIPSDDYPFNIVNAVPSLIRSYSERISSAYVKNEFAGRRKNEAIDKEILGNLVKALNDLLIAEEQFAPIMQKVSDEVEAIDRLWHEAADKACNPLVVLWCWITGDYGWRTEQVEEAAIVELWKDTGVDGRMKLADNPLAVKLRIASRRVERALVVFFLRYCSNNCTVQED